MERHGRGATELLKVATVLIHFVPLATTKARLLCWFELAVTCLVATPTKTGQVSRRLIPLKPTTPTKTGQVSSFSGMFPKMSR